VGEVTARSWAVCSTWLEPTCTVTERPGFIHATGSVMVCRVSKEGSWLAAFAGMSRGPAKQALPTTWPSILAVRRTSGDLPEPFRATATKAGLPPASENMGHDGSMRWVCA
jgi:hypothetical protein